MPGTEKTDTIVIKNIYWMLAYAFRVLDQSNYEHMKTAPFEHVADLLAAILAKGVAQQIKQGLHREYIGKRESLPVIRGRIDIAETIRNKIRRRPEAACEFDELSEDNTLNRILKTTMKALLRTDGVEPGRKSDLKKNLVFFDGVGELPSLEIPWNRLHFRRNDRNYKMLVQICAMILDGMIQTTEKGKYRLAAFEEKNMPRLYEDFLFEYYRKHRPELNPEKKQIDWDYRGGEEDRGKEFMPAMKTDIVLQKDGRVLIIDAKYYGHILKPSRENAREKLPSANLYQIFAYVKNLDVESTGRVSGLLLYAKTNELKVPDCRCSIGGNTIAAQTLDLSTEFDRIKDRLNRIADDFLALPSPAE